MGGGGGGEFRGILFYFIFCLVLSRGSQPGECVSLWGRKRERSSDLLGTIVSVGAGYHGVWVWVKWAKYFVIKLTKWIER